MRQILLLLTIITGLAACKSDPEPIEKTGSVQLLPSAAPYNNNSFSDTGSTVASQKIAEKVNERPVKIIYITKEIKVPAKAVSPVQQEVPVPVAPPAIPSGTGTGETNNTTVHDGQVQPASSTETTPITPQPEKKKGWNNAAKGAVIGAGTGAIGGAILSKKKGLGAVIGGVVGAAGGYIIGKNIDKKKQQFTESSF